MKLSDKRPRPKILEKNIARLFFKSRTELLPEEYQLQVDLPITEFEIRHQKLILSGWKIIHPEEKGTVLFYHGSTGTLKSWLLLFHYLNRKGYSIWSFEYAGYGKSNKETTFSSFLYDCRVATDYIAEQDDFHTDNLILYGHSMGCFALQQAILVDILSPKNIILQSPIFSMDQLLKSRVPAFFRSWLGFKRFSLEPLYTSNHFLHVLIGELDDLITKEELESWQKRANTHVVLFPKYKHASFINPKPQLLDSVFL
jgi:acetyl esterase/lipase